MNPILVDKQTSWTSWLDEGSSGEVQLGERFHATCFHSSKIPDILDIFGTVFEAIMANQPSIFGDLISDKNPTHF